MPPSLRCAGLFVGDEMERLSILVPLLLLGACQGEGRNGNAASGGNAADPAAAVTSQQAAPAPAESTNGSVVAPGNGTAAASVPAGFDWAFLTHGGSGDLWFGDGNWADGENLLGFSCLPDSGEISLSGERPLSVRAGGQAAMLQPDNPVPTSHPVLQALRSSGSLVMVEGGSERVLAAKVEGRQALSDFFRYCGSAGGR